MGFFDQKTLYCRIWVDTDLPEAALVDLLVRFTKGEKQEGKFAQILFIMSEALAFDILENEDFWPEATGIGKYLYSRYYLDVDPMTGTSRSHYVAAIADLLQKLWDNGYEAVAGCDFVDELPRNGGYPKEWNINPPTSPPKSDPD